MKPIEADCIGAGLHFSQGYGKPPVWRFTFQIPGSSSFVLDDTSPQAFLVGSRYRISFELIRMVNRGVQKV